MAKKSLKGGEFERTVCKRLSRWWSQDETPVRDDIFWRTAGSGARATTRFKSARLRTAGGDGDIAALCASGQPFLNRFLIELKRGYSSELTLVSMVDGSSAKPLLSQFWLKAQGEAVRAGRPDCLIIFKRDRGCPCITMSARLYNQIHDIAGTPVGSRYTFIRYDSLALVIFPLEDFLEWFNPAHLDLLPVASPVSRRTK